MQIVNQNVRDTEYCRIRCISGPKAEELNLYLGTATGRYYCGRCSGEALVDGQDMRSAVKEKGKNEESYGSTAECSRPVI
jgi:hypothetical protein